MIIKLHQVVRGDILAVKNERVQVGDIFNEGDWIILELIYIDRAPISANHVTADNETEVRLLKSAKCE